MAKTRFFIDNQPKITHQIVENATDNYLKQGGNIEQLQPLDFTGMPLYPNILELDWNINWDEPEGSLMLWVERLCDTQKS